MVTVIGYASTRFGTTLAFFATAKMAAFAASNSWPPPSQFLLYVTVNFISDVVVVTFLPPKAEDDDADDPPRNRKEASRAGKDDDKDKPFDDEGTHFQTKRRLKAGLQAEKQYFERTV